MKPRSEKQGLDNLRALFKDELRPLLTPPPNTMISEWADDNVWLGADVTSQPGPWRTSFAPYQKGIMDAIKDRATEKIVIMKAARVGITYSAILIPVGYYVHNDPCPIMIALPTGEDTKVFSKTILTPFLMGVKAIRHHFIESRRMESNNTAKLKMFPGGSIRLVASNSPNNLRMTPAKIALADEVDAEIGMTEGNFLSLFENRTKAYAGRGRKLIYLSTPIIKGMSVIEAEYINSTMERFHLPCPSCGVMQPMEWGRINFEDATHACLEEADGGCGASHNKREWTKGWEKTGEWVAQNPDHTTRGFHVSALYSPFLSWESIIEEWRNANREAVAGRTEKLQAFINTNLGETWEVRGETADETSLMSRRTEYYADVPDGVCCYTIAVDTQDNRLAVEVVGWGRGKESWGLGYFELWGDPRIHGSGVWQQLDEIILQTRAYANGVVVPRACVTIDMGGHATEQVRAYAKARRGWNVWAVRGVAGDSKALLHTRVNSKLAGTYEFNLAVNAGKDDVIARLKIETPGPGYCHFPRSSERDATGDYVSVRGYDERYFLGLTAEKKVLVRKKNGHHKYEWQVMAGRNNEPFDLRVYNLAAFEISNFPLERYAEAMPWVKDMPANQDITTAKAVTLSAKPTLRGGTNRQTQTKMRLNSQLARNNYTSV